MFSMIDGYVNMLICFIGTISCQEWTKAFQFPFNVGMNIHVCALHQEFIYTLLLKFHCTYNINKVISCYISKGDLRQKNNKYFIKFCTIAVFN